VGVFDRTDHLKDAGHEQVVFCQDPASGLRAIIAIYSTALGPALGGTRFYPYADEAAALSDVLALSKAMAYKAACAGVDLGGGKAVILGDPATMKTEPLLRAYGRMVESLGGRYYTACDVGTFVQDMDVIAKESRFVTGRSPEHGGAGDSAVLTAYGVFQSMRAAAQVSFGTASLSGRRVGVEGVGKVGFHLVEHLLEEGATVFVSDVNEAAVARAVALGAQPLSVAELPTYDLDVYAPCALGASLTDDLVPALKATVVCGAANNQLQHPGAEKMLADRGFVVGVPSPA
jgi:valine dehydrogenase (NAD+)